LVDRSSKPAGGTGVVELVLINRGLRPPPCGAAQSVVRELRNTSFFSSLLSNLISCLVTFYSLMRRDPAQHDCNIKSGLKLVNSLDNSTNKVLAALVARFLERTYCGLAVGIYGREGTWWRLGGSNLLFHRFVDCYIYRM